MAENKTIFMAIMGDYIKPLKPIDSGNTQKKQKN
jgi:hypothetical protein